MNSPLVWILPGAAMPVLLLGLAACSAPATGGEPLAGGPRPGFALDADERRPASGQPLSNRPRYVPGKGWTTLVPYAGDSYIEPDTGRIWIRTPHGATQPSTGGFIPDRP